MISGLSVQPGSRLHGSCNRLWGRVTKGHQGARKGRAILPAFPKSSTRSVMNHSKRWLLAGSRASGGEANQDNPVYRSRFHSPVPVLGRNATTPLHPAAALAARQGENEGWGTRALGRAPMDRMGWPLPADPGAPAGAADRSDRLRKSVGTSGRFRTVLWACQTPDSDVLEWEARARRS